MLKAYINDTNMCPFCSHKCQYHVLNNIRFNGDEYDAPRSNDSDNSCIFQTGVLSMQTKTMLTIFLTSAMSQHSSNIYVYVLT
eukprot:scaffold48631_cov57-Attheya_sp.AAC.1